MSFHYTMPFVEKVIGYADSRPEFVLFQLSVEMSIVTR